jgi:hypothetical protein
MSSVTAPGFWKYVGAPSPPPPPPPPPSGSSPYQFFFDFNFIESTSNDMMTVGTEYQTNPGTNSMPVVFSGTSTALSESYVTADFPDQGFEGKQGTLGFDHYGTPPPEGITTIITFPTGFRRRYMIFSLDKLGEFDVKLTTNQVVAGTSDVHVIHFDLTIGADWTSASHTGDLSPDFDPYPGRQITGIKFVRGMGSTSFSPYYYIDNFSATFTDTLP